ncbi:MAG: hypothetical protein ABI333_00640 [bacterium]
MRKLKTALVCASFLLLACGDDSSGTNDAASSGGDGGPGVDAAVGSDAATGQDAAVEPDAGCSDTLADAVRLTDVSISNTLGSQAITAEVGAGSVVAWAATDGIHVTPLDGDDQRAGVDLVVEGSRVFGVEATAADIALLVSRPPDYMTFTRVDHQGAVLASADLVGGGDHGVEGVEWFGEFATTGRLVARDDGTYAAYHALHRHWPDGVGHQGDTLRLLDAAAQPLGGGWGWGCSHSMDQRIAFGSTGLVPICIADCYPGKGIYYNHNQALITEDPAANCAGGYTTALGGLVAVADGFWLVFQDDDGGAHLGHYDAGGQLLNERLLSVEGSSRLAAYGNVFLLGSAGGGGCSLQELDATGADIGVSFNAAVSLPAQDFESRSNGEVAWAVASGTTLTVVRVQRLCQ